jgi:O-antigen/teichoic acid export membrane protein
MAFLSSSIAKFYKVEFYRNLLTMVSGTTLAQAVPFLIYPVLTRLYAPEDFGVFSVFLTVCSFLFIVATFRFEYAIMLPPEQKKADYLVSLCLLTTGVVALATLVLSVPASWIVSHFKGVGETTAWLFLVPLSVLLQGVYLAFTAWLNRGKAFRASAAASVTQSLGSSLFRMGFGFLGVTLLGLVYGYLIGQVLTVALLAWMLVMQRGFRPVFSVFRMKEIWREYRMFPKFKTPHALVNNLSTNIPVYMLSTWFGVRETGLFALGTTLVQTPLNILINSLYQVLYQKFTSMHNEGKSLRGAFHKSVSRLLLIAAVPFLVVLLAAPAITGWFFGKEYHDAGIYLQLMVPYLFTSLMIGPFNFIPDIFAQQKKSMQIEFASFVLRVLSVFIGVLFHSVIAGILSYSLFGAGIAVYSYFWYLYLLNGENKEQ